MSVNVHVHNYISQSTPDWTFYCSFGTVTLKRVIQTIALRGSENFDISIITVST